MSVRVLIVEDEPFIALDWEDRLTEAGFEIGATSPSVERALQAIETQEFDVAVLDGNLRGESVEPVAVALRERGIPFLFVTGYGRDALPQGFRDAPFISKPVEPVQLVTTVRKLVGG